jgi:hypothetical protein
MEASEPMKSRLENREVLRAFCEAHVESVSLTGATMNPGGGPPYVVLSRGEVISCYLIEDILAELIRQHEVFAHIHK